MKLRAQDIRLFNLVFESDPGWIMDFSNKTLTEFFDDELNIDINHQEFLEDGPSKAKRVRCLLRKSDRPTVLRVLAALWQYKNEMQPESARASKDNYSALITRLENANNNEASGIATPKFWSKTDWRSLITEMDAMKLLDPHPRGYRFEVWLRELFSVFGMAPRESFRNTGEQIDGSFRLNDEFYLLEAKWHKHKTPAADLHTFEGKLSTKATWARGVFISWMGFTPEGLTAFGKGKRVICVSSYDLYHSLKNQVPLPVLLEAKLRHAAETGEPYGEYDRLNMLKSYSSRQN